MSQSEVNLLMMSAEITSIKNKVDHILEILAGSKKTDKSPLSSVVKKEKKEKKENPNGYLLTEKKFFIHQWELNDSRLHKLLDAEADTIKKSTKYLKLTTEQKQNEYLLNSLYKYIEDNKADFEFVKIQWMEEKEAKKKKGTGKKKPVKTEEPEAEEIDEGSS